MTAPGHAFRIDELTGIRESAGFLGRPNNRILGFTHAPLSPARAGVVVCSPLFAELDRNYRREVLLARGLAAAGVAVQRFHYRGQGSSDGDVVDMNLTAMIDDAAAATEHLMREARTDHIGFLGARFGALVAAAVAKKFGRGPLILWDPCLDPSSYFRDIVRVGRMRALKTGVIGEPLGDSIDELEQGRPIDILGYSIGASLYRSSLGHTLEREAGMEPRPILVVRLGTDKRLHHGLLDLVERLRARGFEVETISVGRQEPWWFTAGALVIKHDLVDLSVDWLTRALDRPEVGV
jgi:alpha-beta hydrolase superfamily lysophospholipase